MQTSTTNSLNPFWFRAGGVRSGELIARKDAVLIPFGSGLGGFANGRWVATAVES